MSSRPAAIVPAASIGLMIGAAWLDRDDPDLIALIVIGVWLTILSLVAGVVAARQPRNAVGWLLQGAALSIATSMFVTAYAKRAIEVAPGSLPYAETAAWMSLWVSGPAVALFIGALLLFPNGRLLSRWWRWPLAILAVSTAFATVGFAAKPGPIDSVPSLDNPVSFPGGIAIYDLTRAVLEHLVTGVALAAVVSLFLRMRRARGPEREQLKWFVYTVAMFPVLFTIAMAADAFLDAQLGPGDHYIDFVLIMIGAISIPVAMGVSILKYRLYDIDVVINKTLVYVTLTAILGGSYLGMIVLLQSVIPVARNSDLAVAASTLGVAGLFQPLRTRLQSFIDKRFYRRRYDAAATLGEFSTHLRDQVDLDALNRELVGVVVKTMQPAHTSLWLRAR